MKDLLIPVSLFCLIVSAILLSAYPSIVDVLQQKSYEQEIVDSLFLEVDFRGHVWHVAPMESRLVALIDSRVVTVLYDEWDSCEHNPDQKHTLVLGYVDLDLYKERVKLDENFATRNVTATRELLILVDSSQVNYVIK